MGTTYFILLIATCLGGAFLHLRKVNANSYLVGARDNAHSEALKIQKASEKNKTEHPRVEAYVDWYMTRLESARCAKARRRNLGMGYIINDPAIGNSDQRSHAVH